MCWANIKFYAHFTQLWKSEEWRAQKTKLVEKICTTYMYFEEQSFRTKIRWMNNSKSLTFTYNVDWDTATMMYGWNLQYTPDACTTLQEIVCSKTLGKYMSHTFSKWAILLKIYVIHFNIRECTVSTSFHSYDFVTERWPSNCLHLLWFASYAFTNSTSKVIYFSYQNGVWLHWFTKHHK